MRISVTKKKVAIAAAEQINGSEKGVNSCEFILPDEFAGLTVTAVFNGVPVLLEQDNTCVMPPLERGDCTLGVYAYREENGETELMYSPSPAVFYVERGSFETQNGAEISVDISLYEQYCVLIRNRADELMDDFAGAEVTRAAAEDIRLAAEAERASAESARETAEAAREAAESARAAAETNRQAALLNALGIHSLVIADTDSGVNYIPQLKIENGKPRLYLDAAAEEEE